MASQLTAEYLMSCIRNAKDLGELRRIVGPTDDEIKQSKARLSAMDKIFENNGTDMHTWPWHALDSYKALERQQRIFENTYL